MPDLSRDPRHQDPPFEPNKGTFDDMRLERERHEALRVAYGKDRKSLGKPQIVLQRTMGNSLVTFSAYRKPVEDRTKGEPRPYFVYVESFEPDEESPEPTPSHRDLLEEANWLEVCVLSTIHEYEIVEVHYDKSNTSSGADDSE